MTYRSLLIDDPTRRVPRVYLAGPYRADTINGIAENIAAARRVAVEFWRRGFPTFTPHLNSGFMDGAAPDEVWLAGDMLWLDVADVVCLLPGWRCSTGATAEHAAAKEAIYWFDARGPWEGSPCQRIWPPWAEASAILT